MEQLHRMVLLFGGCLLILVLLEMKKEQADYYIQTWTDAEVTFFFEKMCREGECTLEEIREIMERLSFNETVGNLQIEEYQTILGPDGKQYRYLITWEEIKENIEQDGEHCFLAGSEIRLYLGDKVYYGQENERRK